MYDQLNKVAIYCNITIVLTKINLKHSCSRRFSRRYRSGRGLCVAHMDEFICKSCGVHTVMLRQNLVICVRVLLSKWIYFHARFDLNVQSIYFICIRCIHT